MAAGCSDEAGTRDAEGWRLDASGDFTDAKTGGDVGDAVGDASADSGGDTEGSVPEDRYGILCPDEQAVARGTSNTSVDPGSSELRVATRGVCRKEIYEPSDVTPSVVHLFETNELGLPEREIIDGEFNGAAPNGEPNEIIGYEYTLTGDVEAERFDVDADGQFDESIYYTYDELGRLRSELYDRNADGSGAARLIYYYDEDGRIERIEHVLGRREPITDYLFYEGGLLVAREKYVPPKTEPAGVDTYEYERGFRIRHLNDYTDPGLRDSETRYTYNCDAQLTAKWVRGLGNSSVEESASAFAYNKYLYDEQHRLVEQRFGRKGDPAEDDLRHRYFYDCQQDN